MPYRRITNYHKGHGVSIDGRGIIGMDLDGDHYMAVLDEIEDALPDNPCRVLRLLSYNERNLSGEFVNVTDPGIISRVVEGLRLEHKLIS